MKRAAHVIQLKINLWRAAGQWVVSEYAGDELLEARPFDTEGQARVWMDEAPGTATYQLHDPTCVPGEHIVGEVRSLDCVEA
jgi:hypothetical protein